MISVEHLIETINHSMDIDGNILSIEVEKNEDGNPTKITILSSYHTSPTKEQILEVKITDAGYTKRWVGYIPKCLVNLL